MTEAPLHHPHGDDDQQVVELLSTLPMDELSSSSSSSLSSHGSSERTSSEQIDQMRNRVDAVLATLVSQTTPPNGERQLQTKLKALRLLPENGPTPGVLLVPPEELPEGIHWVVDPYGDQGKYQGDLCELPLPDSPESTKEADQEQEESFPAGRNQTDQSAPSAAAAKKAPSTTTKPWLPHGKGTMEYADGRRYEGDWELGHWHGQGKVVFANQDTYEGGYHSDQRHGFGIYQWNDGRSYEGEFHADQRQGKGIYQWPDGARYVGLFHKGLRHGFGEYTFQDGSLYRGDWNKGKYHGNGVCRWADGRVYEGAWVAGKAHGHGKETRPDGTVRHEGDWVDDRPIRDCSASSTSIPTNNKNNSSRSNST